MRQIPFGRCFWNGSAAPSPFYNGRQLPTTLDLIKRGAEADIYLTEWFGRPAVSKVRHPKSYRNSELDKRLRRQRTVREATMLHSVKSLGISAPLVYFVDANQYTIIMEYVRGSTVHALPPKEVPTHCKEMGRVAGLLHSAGIMHGDLTTSNFILNGGLFLIDMGLSRRTPKPEDWAVDMRLIKEILGSSHAEVLDESWEALLSGYAQTMDRHDKVLHLVAKIESLGRYARVV